MDDILQVQGINEKGFGIIPKLVMQDKRLTAQAKAVYAYFCSYAGAGKTVFSSRKKILYDLGMSINTYYSHFNLLKEYGFIKVEQEKEKNGTFKRNIYTLMEIIPCHNNSDTANSYEQPCLNLPYTVKPCTNICDTNNNNNKNNSININNHVKSSPSAKEDRTEPRRGTYSTLSKEEENALIERMIKGYMLMVKENIDHDSLAVSRPYDMKLALLLNRNLKEALSNGINKARA